MGAQQPITSTVGDPHPMIEQVGQQTTLASRSALASAPQGWPARTPPEQRPMWTPQPQPMERSQFRGYDD